MLSIIDLFSRLINKYRNLYYRNKNYSALSSFSNYVENAQIAILAFWTFLWLTVNIIIHYFAIPDFHPREYSTQLL